MIEGWCRLEEGQVLPGLPTNRPQCKPFYLNKFLSGVFVQFSQSTFLEEIEWLRFNMAKIYLPTYGIWCKLVGSPKFRFFGLVSILCKISDAVDSANEEGERKECQKCHQKGPGETRWKCDINILLNSYFSFLWPIKGVKKGQIISSFIMPFMNASILPRANNATNKETQQFSFVGTYSSPQWEVLVEANRVYVPSSILFTTCRFFRRKSEPLSFRLRAPARTPTSTPSAQNLL